MTFAKNFTFTASYFEFDSPASFFDTARSLNFNLAYDDTDLLGKFALHPHFTYLRELMAPGSAGLQKNGNYYEVGLAPGFSAGPVAITSSDIWASRKRMRSDGGAVQCSMPVPRTKKSMAPARAKLRGDPRQQEVPLTFVRLEPFIVPKTSLTGANTERVDTRVVHVIYAIDPGHPLIQQRKILVGQLLDVFIDTRAVSQSDAGQGPSGNTGESARVPLSLSEARLPADPSPAPGRLEAERGQ